MLTPGSAATWQDRLNAVVALARETSGFTDPQELVRAYGARVRSMLGSAGFVAVSRRDLPPPRYRITRSHLFKEVINPWRNPERLPVFEGGLLGDILYREEPTLIQDLCLTRDDPAYEHLKDARTLMAIPQFDGGVALNMTVSFWTEPNAFDPQRFPDTVWITNLFGRATHNLVLSRQVRELYEAVDREMETIADIQRSLLPESPPMIAGLEFATHYQTSRRAGGDYYDFFDLGDGRWGILVADVAGHGAPAAVLMAILHAIAHLVPRGVTPPHDALAFINRQLSERYANPAAAFVTAFYGVFDPATRGLRYALAGHPPPLLRAGDRRVIALDGARGGLPLGIFPETMYETHDATLAPGDALVLYTDGISEAMNPARRQYGESRLRAVLARAPGGPGIGPKRVLSDILTDLYTFTGSAPISDDQTLLVAVAT